MNPLKSDFDRDLVPSTSFDSFSRGILGGEASTRATVAAASKEDKLIKTVLNQPPKKHSVRLAAPALKKSAALKPLTCKEEKRARSRSLMKESSRG